MNETCVTQPLAWISKERMSSALNSTTFDFVYIKPEPKSEYADK